jgi:hypothetical protein
VNRAVRRPVTWAGTCRVWPYTKSELGLTLPSTLALVSLLTPLLGTVATVAPTRGEGRNSRNRCSYRFLTASLRGA